MELGADLATVRRLVLSQGAQLSVGGVMLGVLGAIAVRRVMATLLYGVGAGDPATFASVTVVLGAVALFATYLPARRAARVNPVDALRYE
jgi:ABC-type antimicrobial peptide transport system permease subunit